MEIRGSVAIVTGASRGIGEATALALAAGGARVGLAARSPDDLERVAATIRNRGGEALAVPADVTRPEDVERLVGEVAARLGPVDLLVANAGAYLRRPVLELAATDVDASLAINLRGALDPILAVLPGMVERRRGHIAIVNSIDGRKGLPGDAPYVVAKFALTGLGQVLRQELRPHGIGVTSVFPGRVDTAMIAGLAVPWISRKLAPETVARALVAGVRAGRAEVVVPRLGRALVCLDCLSPRLGDWIVRALRLTGRWERGR